MDRSDWREKFCGAYYKWIYKKKILIDGEPTNKPLLKRMLASVCVRNSTRQVKVKFKKVMLPKTKLSNPVFEEVSRFRREVGDIKLESIVKNVSRFKDKPWIFFTHHKHITVKLSQIIRL